MMLFLISLDGVHNNTENKERNGWTSKNTEKEIDKRKKSDRETYLYKKKTESRLSQKKKKIAIKNGR